MDKTESHWSTWEEFLKLKFGVVQKGNIARLRFLHLKYKEESSDNPDYDYFVTGLSAGCPRSARTEVPTFVGGELSEANFDEAVAGRLVQRAEAEGKVMLRGASYSPPNGGS